MYSDRDASKEAVREVIAEYYPEKLTELEVVFETVYNSLHNKKSRTTGNGTEKNSELSIDGFGVGDGIVAYSIYIAVKFLTVTARDFIENDLPDKFDKLETTLTNKSIDPNVVHGIRIRLERILKKM